MADDPKLAATLRTKVGSIDSRRLRRDNRIPGNVYGHGEGPQAIAVAEETLAPIVASGHKVVDLAIDGGSQKAILREVQWDTFGTHLLHFDLQRVSAGERVLTDLAVHTHGSAPGVAAGGILEIVLHTLHVDCSALEIPDGVEINVNHLDLGAVVHVRDLGLPESVKVLHDPDDVVVHVIEPRAVAVEEGDAGPTGAEPELVEEKGGEE